jgi:hypothetical protein
MPAAALTALQRAIAPLSWSDDGRVGQIYFFTASANSCAVSSEMIGIGNKCLSASLCTSAVIT